MSEFGVLTRHFDPIIKQSGKPYRLNNSNQIIGFGYRYGDFTFSVSHFINSFRRSSFMVNTDYKLFSLCGVDVAFGWGLTSGYTPEIQKGLYFGRMMVVEEVSVSPKVGLFRIGDVNVTPKLRVMGLDVAMFDIELS
ncbi:hypothetical protein [Photobacterium damselae]|uniref:hypothetical protein n=1 Tax=Photobacterium damselae TaxID=38293 RepID=UPI001F256284|nr:hypothetical protein [Photobacterium damselae]UKA04436.1 hypothetical protein IHC89_22705 [Photobacterium damselae subsp. damselae]